MIFLAPEVEVGSSRGYCDGPSARASEFSAHALIKQELLGGYYGWPEASLLIDARRPRAECQNAGHRKDRLKCPLDRDRFDETKSMVVDLGVLAKADAFVGSLWSNVGRLSYELSAADKGCLPPLISRDVGWCSVDGQLQDGTVYGHLNC